MPKNERLLEMDMMKRTKGVDIIIPVYNALEDLKLCLQSIQKHTDLSLDRVVMIDDRSPDPNVYPYMQSMEQPGIVVMQNTENQGFSGTINRGLEFSDRDVILLNSDTIVTENWVDKIVRCAYSDAAIGTVTPFSNNATLCSIPDFCQENTVPYGLNMEEYARIIERCSMRKYPRITVAVGFCMFIKREVVNTVGLFDQETFQRGYGEENDFCWRAEQLGYHHVLCDDTYIYHSGSSSFVSDEKKILMQEHEAIIQERYPIQNQKNAEYVRDNPHQYLRSNVDIYARLANGKKNILYVLHMDFRVDGNNSIGGTQFHVKDLVSRLRGEYNVFVLAREDRMLRLTAYTGDDQSAFSFYIGEKPAFQPFHHQKIEDALRQILGAFPMDLIHVHHVSGLSFDIFSLAKEMGIPLVATMHDFYMVCPTITLLQNGNAYCGACSKDCVGCLNHEIGYTKQVDYLPLWREKCMEALNACDALVVPSQAVKDITSRVYPELASRIRVVEHGMDPFPQEIDTFRKGATQGLEYRIEHAFEKDYTISGWVLQKDTDCRYNEVLVCLQDKNGVFGVYCAMTGGRQDVAQSRGDEKYLYSGFRVQIPDGAFASGALKLQLILRNNGQEFHSEEITVNGYKQREKNRKRIAFLGGLSKGKGSEAAYQMIAQAGGDYDWYIIGGIGDPNLITLERKNLFKTDWYKRESVVAILKQNQIDMVCILSICPETFCYTLSEAQLAGIPVLAADIGALGDRIRRDDTGWLIPPMTPAKEICGKIDSIFADREEYSRVCQNVEQFCHRSIAEMAEDYAALYSEIPAAEKTAHPFDPTEIYNAYVRCQTEAGGGMAGDMDLIRRINELEAERNAICQTLEYRMVKFFNRENIPGKRLFKWMIGVAYRIYVKFFKK